MRTLLGFTATFAVFYAGCNAAEPIATPTAQPLLVEVSAARAPAPPASEAARTAPSSQRITPPLNAGPATPIVQAKAWSFQSRVQHEVSCSQSFETSHETTTYQLSVTPPNLAKLRAEVTYSSTFGPSPSRYRSGAKQFQTTRRQHVFEWSGKARWFGDQLELVLDGPARCSTPDGTGTGVGNCDAPALAPMRCFPTKQQVAATAQLAGSTDDKTTDEQVLTCPEVQGVTKLEIEARDRTGLHFHRSTPIARDLVYGHLASAGRHRAELHFY